MEHTDLIITSQPNQAGFVDRGRSDRAAVSQSGNISAGFIRNREEALNNKLKLNPGASDADRQLAPIPSQDYTLPEIDSTPTDALTQTLAELRELRDELLRQDERSTDGLLLAQVGLVLERIQRDIPSGREAFIAVLRAARLPKPVLEAAEPTTEMAETTT